MGNNSFTDVGIKNIFKGLSVKSIALKELVVNIESNLRASNKNNITFKSIHKIIKFISKLNNLEIVHLCVNSIEQNNLDSL